MKNIDYIHPLLLKTISTIKFPNLTVMNLYENKIETIEGIHRTEMPILKQLYISYYRNKIDYNNLFSIEDLRKGNWFLKKIVMSIWEIIQMETSLTS